MQTGRVQQELHDDNHVHAHVRIVQVDVPSTSLGGDLDAVLGLMDEDLLRHSIDGFGNLGYSVIWIVQMAECRTSDPKVEGSIPFPDAIFHINSLTYVNSL